MTSDDATNDATAAPGARSAASGTPMPVDLEADRRSRSGWVVLLFGPLVWFGHFMLVYLVAEAGCTGDGPGLHLFDPPVPVVTTLVSTVGAVALCGFGTVWACRLWRRSDTCVAPAEAARGDDVEGRLDDDRRRGSLAFAGLLLSAFSVVAVLFTAAPALVLGPC